MPRMTSAWRATLILICGLCVHQSAHAQWVPVRYIPGKEQVIRAVLAAELSPTRLGLTRPSSVSAENIGDLPPLVVAGRKVAVVDPARIEARARVEMVFTYLVFRGYESEGDHLLVSVSRISAGQTCFAGPRHERADYTYRVQKVGGGWRAEVIGQAPAGREVMFRRRAGLQPF